VVLACKRTEPPPVREPSATAAASLASPASAAVPRPPEPTRLLELPGSAYSASLELDGEAAYLLTPEGAFRLVPGEPPRRLDIALGFASTLTHTAFVYWSEGKILSTPKNGGPSKVLAALPKQPQVFVASGEELAWVALDDDGSYALRTLAGGKPTQLFTSRGELSGLDLVGKSLYFVERPTDDSWRIGVVETTAGTPRFRPARHGRRPALLTGKDAIYYYDVDTSEIRRVSRDLSQDDSVLRDVICTPLYAAADVYCASVEGLFVVSSETHAPRILSYGRPGTITGVHADARWVVWTVDLGPNRLAVDLLPVAPGR
jgi:hypothetical protein